MKVFISITRSTRYKKTVEMTTELYKKLCDKMDRGGRSYQEALEEIDGFISPEDWVDDSIEDVDDFTSEEEGETE